MEDYLASLAAEQECLFIFQGGKEGGREGGGVGREPLSVLRQLEGHVIVVCQLANLSCLGYFLAPLRQGGREGGKEGPAVVVMISLADEEGGRSAKSGRERGKKGSVAASSCKLNRMSSANGSSSGGGGGRRRRRGLRKVVESLRRFGPLYLMEGDASTDVSLRRAGLGQAQSCVMMADKSSSKVVDGHFVDNASLRRFLSIQKFLFESAARQSVRPDFRFLCEVQSSSTLKIMNR
jgi:hypothetical protein